MAKKPRPGARVEVTIGEIDARGQGVGRVDGYAVRVRGAVPGDRVLAVLRKVRNRRREAEGRVLELLDCAIPREGARCAHFGACGGCTWQDVPYERQVALKEDLVLGELHRAGIHLDLDETLTAPDPYHYRNKMEFSFGSAADGGVAIGLHHAGRYDRVFDLETCHLQSVTSNGIVDRVRRFCRDRGLTSYHLKRHDGVMRFLTIREGKRTGEAMVVLTTSGEAFPDAGDLAVDLMRGFSEVRCVVHSINRRKAQIAIGDEERTVGGNGTICERLGDFSFEVSPSSFFQPNTQQAERMFDRIVELVDPRPRDRILDVYCGIGGISLYLSRRSREVLGVESSEFAVRDAVRNSALNGVTNCRFMAGQAEDVLRQLRREGAAFEAAVTDPPRVGMRPKALAALGEMGPQRLVYVSCNPRALGNDLSALGHYGYQAESAQLVDMLPHTPHCEVLVRAVRETA